MIGALADFQNAFAQALLAPPEPAAGTLAALIAQPGFAVYRNTVIKSCIDALQANYPAVARLTGEGWFRSAAATYVRSNLPRDPSLLRYGASFPDFVAALDAARDLPYLPGVARLDRLWTEAHSACDEVVLSAAAIANLEPAQLAAAVLHPHAAVRWTWFANAPVFSIWSHNRGEGATTDTIWEPRWQAEGALLTRAHHAVEWFALDAAGCAFLDACANGKTLRVATTAALAADQHTNLRQLMRMLLEAGAFSYISITRVNIRGEKSYPPL